MPPLPALCVVSSAVEAVGILGELCLASRVLGACSASKLLRFSKTCSRAPGSSALAATANMEESDERLVGAKDGDYIYECTVCHTHTHKHTHRPTNSLHED